MEAQNILSIQRWQQELRAAYSAYDPFRTSLHGKYYFRIIVVISKAKMELILTLENVSSSWLSSIVHMFLDDGVKRFLCRKNA